MCGVSLWRGQGEIMRMYNKSTCTVYTVARFWQPPYFDGLSRPTLLLGTCASTKLVCTFYVTGVRGMVGGVCVSGGGEGWGRVLVHYWGCVLSGISRSISVSSVDDSLRCRLDFRIEVLYLSWTLVFQIGALLSCSY
jgi:hypothetical protein